MRIVKAPSGVGSAEQWVRQRFGTEVKALRNRRAETKLLVMIDADKQSVQRRIQQLDSALQTEGHQPIDLRTEQVARLVPKRNIETWLLCLTGEQVNEEDDFKKTGHNWPELIPIAANAMYDWTRQNAPFPDNCVASLQFAISELQRIGL